MSIRHKSFILQAKFICKEAHNRLVDGSKRSTWPTPKLLARVLSLMKSNLKDSKHASMHWNGTGELVFKNDVFITNNSFVKKNHYYKLQLYTKDNIISTSIEICILARQWQQRPPLASSWNSTTTGASTNLEAPLRTTLLMLVLLCPYLKPMASKATSGL